MLEYEPNLATEIQNYLTFREIECQVAYDGNICLKYIQNFDFDVVLLDINVPGINGLEVCKKIRQENPRLPIMMLTAFGQISDKIEAFSAGADDYLVKPFHLEELRMRIMAVYKRLNYANQQSEIIKIADLEINFTCATVKRAEQDIKLTAKEYKLLELLVRNQGKIVSKQQILDFVWNQNFDTGTNTVEVYISFLRNKIDKNFTPKLIHTKTGFGYYLAEEEH
ncbi:MAG: response regulator transcription factor [Bacteroidia bacterium]|nr:response regulator transcription factor [Bacteroidia bacterium]